jgi:sulfur-oxidizing protein SoxA
VLAYRQALADKDGNPGRLIIDRGEKLFKTPAGPKAATLERCDFGLGPGVLKGAYAQLPRWFADTHADSRKIWAALVPMHSCRAGSPTPSECRTWNRAS